MYERDHLKQRVEDLLGPRDLVWAGLRGADAEALSDIAQFRAAASIIDSYSGRADVDDICYEDASGRRPDLEVWDIDNHLGAPETEWFRRRLLQRLASESALVPYRPSRFLSAISFARSSSCLYLGVHGAYQQAFDHKPWVETMLRDEGIPMIPWRYVSDDDRHVVDDHLERGSLVLRRSRTSGGEGIVKVNCPADLEGSWLHTDEGFLSIAPFRDDCVPINVGATVWPDGVTIHLPSVQIIGISSCATRQFGYCGNDFSIAKDLERATMISIEDHTRTIGRWLHRLGYRGTFGVDYLLRNGQPLFTEINPRFQGSTPASSRLAISCGRSDLLLEHIAAFLGVPAPAQEPLSSMAREMDDRSQLIVHSTQSHPAQLDPSSLPGLLAADGVRSTMEVATRASLVTDPGAVVCRLGFSASVTETGFEIEPRIDSVLREWQRTRTESETADAQG